MADWVTISSLATAGGQRVISRFALTSGNGTTWLSSVGRHWNLDPPDPR